jgi:hypothetical protein
MTLLAALVDAWDADAEIDDEVMPSNDRAAA